MKGVLPVPTVGLTDTKLSLVGSVSFLSCAYVKAVFKEAFVAAEDTRWRGVMLNHSLFFPLRPVSFPKPQLFHLQSEKVLIAGGLAEATLQKC